jgi:hypothetical protein
MPCYPELITCHNEFSFTKEICNLRQRDVQSCSVQL